MTKLTFLEAADGRTIGKTYKPKMTEGNPQVKLLNSYEYTPTTIKERFDLICEHAAKGHCMLRGELTKLLHKESRAKLTDTTKPNTTLLLDVDKLQLDNYTPSTSKLRSSHVESICERVIALLPVEMHNSSYIGHASSSMGQSQSTHVSVHIEFMLDDAINPAMLKDYVQHLNYACEDISKQLKLSENSTSIKAIMDPCVSDNSHLVYIAAPTFIDVEDPFQSPEHRFCLVEKTNEKLALTGQLATMIDSEVAAIQNKRMDQLRKLRSLKPYRPKRKDYTTKEGKIRVVINPDQFKLTV